MKVLPLAICPSSSSSNSHWHLLLVLVLISVYSAVFCFSMSSSSITLRTLTPPPCKTPSVESLRFTFSSLLTSQLKIINKTHNYKTITTRRNGAGPLIMCCSNSSDSSLSTTTTSTTTTTPAANMGPPVIKKRKRYRKPYPGESNGITEEMRFVAMRLRNIKGKYTHKASNDTSDVDSQDSGNDVVSENKEEKEQEGEGNEESWVPGMEGFLKYLIDSKVVFDTVEGIIDKSEDVSYAYFRKTGLERSEALAKDLEWFSQREAAIPEPSVPGVSYGMYLQKLAEKSAPLFLCHFYNIYFSHIAGGQVIGRKVSAKLLEGRELEFYRWDGDAEELLKGVREKINMLGEHWPRDEKNKCLKETRKAFKHMGSIVRLIIL